MRTTISLDADTYAAAEALRRKTGMGISHAVNRLMREGISMQTKTAPRFVQRTADLGIRMNVDNTAEILDLLDEDNRPPR